MISNKHFCGEKCFKLGFDLLVEESNLSKLSIKNKYNLLYFIIRIYYKTLL